MGQGTKWTKGPMDKWKNFQLHLVRRKRECETSLQNTKEYGGVIEDQSEAQIKPQHMCADKPVLPGR